MLLDLIHSLQRPVRLQTSRESLTSFHVFAAHNRPVQKPKWRAGRQQLLQRLFYTLCTSEDNPMAVFMVWLLACLLAAVSDLTDLTCLTSQQWGTA